MHHVVCVLEICYGVGNEQTADSTVVHSCNFFISQMVRIRCTRSKGALQPSSMRPISPTGVVTKYCIRAHLASNHFLF